jgi:hypothetical protein
MTGDWRDFRPAIWLAMFGIAVMLLVSPFWYGAVFIGAAIGAAIRIHQRRRRIAASTSGRVGPGTGRQVGKAARGGGRASAGTKRSGRRKRRHR